MDHILNDDIRAQLQTAFAGLDKPVEILLFTSSDNPDSSESTRQVLEEVASLSDLINLSSYDIVNDKKTAVQYKVDKTPTYIIAARDGDKIIDYGIRAVGIPQKYEFTSLIEGILLVSSRKSGLKEETLAFLRGLQNPLQLQVFVTPT
jgi:alkyl hydroperoxide reductase subunit AhpF